MSIDEKTYEKAMAKWKEKANYAIRHGRVLTADEEGRIIIEAYESAKAPATQHPDELAEVDYREALRQIANGCEDPMDVAHMALHHGTPLKRETVTLSEAEKLELAEVMKRRASYFKDSDMRAALEAILERFELRRRK